MSSSTTTCERVARLPNALTVAPMPTDVELEVTGAFKAPPEPFLAQLKVGDNFPSPRASDRGSHRGRRPGGRRPAPARRRRNDRRATEPARYCGDSPCQMCHGAGERRRRTLHGVRPGPPGRRSARRIAHAGYAPRARALSDGHGAGAEGRAGPESITWRNGQPRGGRCCRTHVRAPRLAENRAGRGRSPCRSASLASRLWSLGEAVVAGCTRPGSIPGLAD